MNITQVTRILPKKILMIKYRYGRYTGRVNSANKRPT